MAIAGLKVPKPSFGPYWKLAIAILALYGAQAAWANNVNGTAFPVEAWASWWWQRIVTVGRYLNGFWNGAVNDTPTTTTVAA